MIREEKQTFADVVNVVDRSEVTDFSLSPKTKCHVTLKSSRSSLDFMNESLAYTLSKAANADTQTHFVFWQRLSEACFMNCIHQNVVTTPPKMFSLWVIYDAQCVEHVLSPFNSQLTEFSCVSQPVWRREVLSRGEETLQIL